MQIKNNTLMSGSDISRLTIEDDYYVVKFYYIGNYAEDIKTGLDLTYLSAMIRVKKEVMPLTVSFRDKLVCIEQEFFYVPETDIDKMIQKFEKTKEEISEIRKYLEEYFFPYYETEK